MIFLSTNSPEFPYEEAQRLYHENKKYFLPLDITFDKLTEVLRGNLWACVANGLFVGLIYFELRDDKWFLSGCSNRKMFKYITGAITGLCQLYFEQTNTIYSETDFKHAKQALKRAGFINIYENIYRKDKK